MLKRMIAFCLLLALLLPHVSLARAESKGVSIADDKTFFSKLNLSHSGMEKVKTAVDKSDFSTAKKELLSYYQTAFTKYKTEPFSTATDTSVFMAMNDVWAFSENYISGVTVTSTSYEPYTLDLGGNLKGIYILDQIYATTDGVGIATSESNNPPRLSLYSSNGTLLKTINATEDTAVRPGKDLSAGLGSSTVMYAKHWPDTKNSLPYSSSTTRCYIRFDTTQIPSNAKTAKLTVYCKRSPGNADKVLVEDSLYLCAFQSYCTNWSEDSLTWDTLVAGNYVGHYSYDGLSGGFDWKKPKGTPSEWLNYNTRFYEVRNLVIKGTEATDTATRNRYMNKAKSLVLDFINDAGANTPKNRALEPANRLIEFPFIYQKLICGGYLTADENVKILSWLYDDTTDQYNGAYTIFSGATATPKSNLAYTNWGLWHLTGFYSTICYFPEFNESASWRSVYDARLGVVMGAIIKEDGSYNEVTYGYPGNVISWCATLKNLINQFGDQSANAEMFSQKMLLLTKYLIDCSLPNGKPPFWGEGGPAATKTAVNTTLEGLSAKELQSDLAKYLQNYLDSDYGIPLENMVQYDGIQLVVDRAGRSSTDSMIFMNAKSAGSHSHRDALALLLHYDGRNLLADTGMTSYDSGHQHFAFQRSSTRSHNTIEMDGIAQTLGTMVDDGRHQGDIDISGNSAVSTITSWSTASNPNLSSLKVEGTTSSKATHSTTFTHSRDVSFLKELGSILIVTDKVEPQDSASHTYTQNWHAAPYSNAAIAKDAYLTGSTAYSSGPNLIIAQASTSGITASLQTGYDSSAPATPTKYFEYKQTASGAVTYQTVIYPVSEGVSATVQPKKISMSNTKDTQAMAMEIAVIDTAKPNLSKIFHYHSFEDSPSQRSFGSYSTNAMTAMTALDQNGKVYFASLANGSSLTKNGKSVLSATVSLTDLTAVYDNGVVHLYSEDLRAQGCDYSLNFDSQKVTEVYLNDKPMSFTQSTDGTVETAPTYVLMDFTSDSLAAEDSHWSGMRTTTDVDQSKGILSGTINGGDPYISMTDKAQSIGYEIKQGDVIEIRMKTKISEGTGKGIQVFFRSDDTAKFAEASSCKSLSMEHATGRYYTIQLPFNASAAYIGTTIDKLRIDVLHLGSDETVTAKYEIDYIYLGPKASAPSASAKEGSYLFFDFTNKRVDEERYATETYGGYSFDSECWGYNPSRNTAPVIDQKEGTLSIHIKEDNTQSYVQTTTQGGGLFDMPLYYLPKAGDTVQVRLRFENCIATSTNPTISLYYIANDSAEVTNDHRSGRLGEEAVNTGKDIVVQFTPSNGFLESDCINAVRFTVSGVADDGSGQSRIVFDFFYIGSEEHLPLQDKLYFGFDNQEVDQERYNTLTYGGYNFDLGCWGANVSRAQIPVLDPEKGTLTVQITEGSNGPYFQTTTGPNNLNTRPLSYIPGENDLVQLRVKFRNCKGSSPNLCLYYMKDGGSVTSNHSKIPVDPNLLDADQFAVYTFSVPDGFTTAEVINSIRITAAGVSEKVTGQAQIEFDYIYIGPEKDLPTPGYTVTFLNGDGSVLHTLKVHKGETVAYTGETPTKAFDNSNHYTFKGWDKALTDIKANITVTPTFTAVPHSYTYAKLDGNSHSATCSCGYHKTEGHNFVYKATKNPSTSTTGTLTGTCSICSETATVTLPKLNTTDYTKSVTKAPTCTATGTDKYTWKTTTYGTFSFDVTTKAKGHTSVTDKAVAPTCTATGLTEGAHCSVCNEVLTAQTIVAALGHSYTYKASKDPTTSATGTLTGTCSKCNGTTTVTLPKLNTTDYTKTTTKAPTCTGTGTDSYKWKTTTYGAFSFNVTTKAKGHTSVTDKAVAPTCTATGLTEGAHCSVCNEVLTAQTVVEAFGHSYNSGVITTEPTCTESGVKTYTCTRCKDSKTETISAKGHKEVVNKAVAATCTERGLTEGKHCSVCNTVFTAQSVVEALGHTVSHGYCTVCGQKYKGTLLDFISNSRELNFNWTVNKHATAPTFDTTGTGYANGQISAPGGEVSTDIHIGMEAKNNKDSIQHKIYSDNEIFQLRVKLDVDVTIPKNSRTKVYFKTDAVGESAGYSDSYMAYTTESTLDEDGYYIISMPIPEEFMGQIIETVRIDFLDLMVKSAIEGSYCLDYLYMGPACTAPSPVHSYSYTKLDEQSHKAVCADCKTEEVTAHLYVDGSCICGNTESKESLLDSTLKLSHSLNLASDISINFVVPAYLLSGYDMNTVYVESTIENYEGETFLGTETVRIEPVEMGSYYYFTLTGITAVQMNDTISTVLYGEKDGQAYYSNTDLYSVAQYAYSQLNKSLESAPASLKTLCADLLRYGAKAQLYKEYRMSALADANMTEAHKSYLSDLETVTFGNNSTDLGDLANASITWVGKTLDLDSKVCLKFVFSIAGYRGDLKDLSLKVSYRDIYGEPMEVRITELTEYDATRYRYAFSVDTLLASELREVVSVQVFQGATPVSSTFRYSADTYGNHKNGTLLELCKALFAYSDSAVAYFRS